MLRFLTLLLAATAVPDTTASPPLYVLGSSIHLRKEPTRDAEVLEKVPIATECHTTQELSGEWRKVQCGGQEGYVAASLLGPEKPSVERLAAEARDPENLLAKREDSALRASTLAPGDADLSRLLGSLFLERNLKLAALSKAPKVPRTFTKQCFNQTNDACLEDAAAAYVKGIKVRARTKNKTFVVAMCNNTTITVYRGKYQYNKKKNIIAGEVRERTSFDSTAVMQTALFIDRDPRAFDEHALNLGELTLGDDATAILNAVPKEWALLRQENGSQWAQWNDCRSRPFLLSFYSDIHGRWLIQTEEPTDISINMKFESYRIREVSKDGNSLRLTLEEFSETRKTRQETVALPEGNEDIAQILGKTYSYELMRYPEKHHRCIEGGP